MTVESLIAHLQNLVAHGLSPDSIVKAYDGGVEKLMPVTGFLYDNNEVEICTDDID